MKKIHPLSFWINNLGASILEFAIVLPVYLLIVFGIIDFGFLMWQYASISYALSKTERYVYINPSLTNQEIVNYANQQVINFGNAINFTASSTPGVSVQLTGNLTYSFISMVIPKFHTSITVNFPLSTAASS
ncbi:MAG: TadE/TadG family type IV pilus assembly protein [Candidatus Nucleicultricaceae bacterium]